MSVLSSLPLPDERQQLILALLVRDGRVLASDLAKQFATSEDTIRRDLRELAATGHCRRVYGGALPLSPASGTLAQREVAEPSRKAALGRAAASLIASALRPGEVLFLDTGSTNLAIARAMPARLGITVVTNAPRIAVILAALPDTELILIGGRVDPRSGAATGVRAVRELACIRADLAFLGACAVDATAGLAAFDAEEAELKRSMAERAVAVATAVTSDKLGTAAPFQILPASMLTHLVVEADAPEAGLEPLRAMGVEVHRACPPEMTP